ncbi:MAG: hypothetical protein ACOY82_12360 [Pseudomonadota bacterium]
MRTTFQTPQQQAVALDIVPPQAQPAACVRPAIVRPPPPPVKRAKRNVACIPQTTAIARLHAEDVPLFLPPVGKSRIHMQYYAQNLASVRQVLAQQEISRGIDRRLPPDDGGTIPGTSPGTTPGTIPGTGPTPDIDAVGPHLGDIGYAMFARLIAIAAQLADMDKVTVFSHLDKLLKTAKPNIDIALRFLDYYKMFRTHAALKLAVAPEPYLELAKLAQEGRNIDDAFAELLHLGAETMIEAMNCCIEEAPADWRQDRLTPTVAVAPQPSVETPIPYGDDIAIAAAAPAARIGNKRAKKTSGSRSKR